jgi:hypothetical protein
MGKNPGAAMGGIAHQVDRDVDLEAIIEKSGPTSGLAVSCKWCKCSGRVLSLKLLRSGWSHEHREMRVKPSMKSMQIGLAIRL